MSWPEGWISIRTDSSFSTIGVSSSSFGSWKSSPWVAAKVVVIMK